jgi:hypothetical protein
MAEAVTIRNGIDVDQLLATIEAVKEDAAVGTFTFRASSRWQDGTYNVGEIGRFVHAGAEDETRDGAFRLEGDEPPVLLGRNKGPNAVELLLQALGFCYAVGYVANAAAWESSSPRWSMSSRATSTCARSSVWTAPGQGSPRSGRTPGCPAPTRRRNS